MSVRLISAIVVAELPGLTMADKMALLVLAKYADKDGRNAYPSRATIAANGKMTPRQVARSLRNLESKGVIVAIGNRNGGRPGSTTCYALSEARIREETGDMRSPVRGDKTGDPRSETGDPMSGDGGHEVTQSVLDRSLIEKTTPNPLKGGVATPDDDDALDAIFGRSVVPPGTFEKALATIHQRRAVKHQRAIRREERAQQRQAKLNGDTIEGNCREVEDVVERNDP